MQKKLIFQCMVFLLCGIIHAQSQTPKEKYNETKEKTLINVIVKTGNEADSGVDKTTGGIGEKVNKKIDKLFSTAKKNTTIIIVTNSAISNLKALTDRLKKHKSVKSTEKKITPECQTIKVDHTCTGETLFDWLLENISDEYEFTSFTDGILCLKKKDAS